MFHVDLTTTLPLLHEKNLAKKDEEINNLLRGGGQDKWGSGCEWWLVITWDHNQVMGKVGKEGWEGGAGL